MTLKTAGEGNVYYAFVGIDEQIFGVLQTDFQQIFARRASQHRLKDFVKKAFAQICTLCNIVRNNSLSLVFLYKFSGKKYVLRILCVLLICANHCGAVAQCSMKVTDVKCFVVDCFRANWVFVKVYTDEGVDGVGEATLEYKEKALLGAVEHIKEYLTGKNPLDIEKHRHDIYRDAYWRGGAVLMSALSAVETALWDILGKYLNVPVYRLMGGKVNDKVRIYVNGWFAGAKEPEEFAQKAKEAVKRGVTAMKWDPFGKSYLEISNDDLDEALRCVGAVRDAVGEGVDLLIEGHGRFNNPSGPVANPATLQLAASCPNFSILEIMYSDVPWRKDVTNESLEYKDGYMKIPDKPGLGIEIDETECLKHPYKPHTLRHHTGELTNIRPPKSEFYF